MKTNQHSSQESQGHSDEGMEQKERVFEDNLRLRNQIYELTIELENLISRDTQRKKKYGPAKPNEQRGLLEEKKTALKKQHLEMLEMRNKIQLVKKQLETLYVNRNLSSKEQELLALKREVTALEDERDSLLKVKKEQAKSFKDLKSEAQYMQKIQTLKRQLAKTKEETRAVGEKVNEAERILRKNHEMCVAKQSKVKELESKLAVLKEKQKNRRPIQSVSQEMLFQLEEEIGELQRQRRETEKLWYEKLKSIQLELAEKRGEQEKKVLILREKQKEYKLNEIKIKELRKLIKVNLEQQKTDVDMTQFRHKRNIKYM